MVSLKLILEMACRDTPYSPEYTSLDGDGILHHLARFHNDATPMVDIAHISFKMDAIYGVVGLQRS